MGDDIFKLGPRRRDVLCSGLGMASALALSGCAGDETAQGEAPSRDAVPIEAGRRRVWVGAEFWANQLQDWRLEYGVLQCTNGAGRYPVRTVGLLTRSLGDAFAPAVFSARLHRLSARDAKGFGGFLVGVGGGRLDYRAAALAQAGSGEAGGLMAVVETNGTIGFRDHSDEAQPFAFASLPDEETASEGKLSEILDIALRLDPQPDGQFTATLTAYAAGEDRLLARAIARNIAAERLVGGLSLVSSSAGPQGARFGFSQIETVGEKIVRNDTRRLGPVMGTLHSLSDGILKMSAQLMPVGEGDPTRLVLQTRRDNSDVWTKIKDALISESFVAVFRVEDWDDKRAHQFRLVYPGSDEALWSGTIRPDPKGAEEIKVALFSCVLTSSQSLDVGTMGKYHEQERTLGRYTHDNIYFPHRDLSRNAAAHDPDIAVFCGDQYYEFNPVRPVYRGKHVVLDTLYRWYLWYWSFRELVRDRPAIVLTDDHDVLQGNVWGQGGRDAPDGKEAAGGYVHGAALVTTIHHIQCGHNPDAYDPAPIENGIPVTYGAFRYGGTSFAFVEDRKFKAGPNQPAGYDFASADLLGPRQEAFLRDWIDQDRDLPKILVSQTPWACVETTDSGGPMRITDSNGFPPVARQRAIRLVAQNGALMLAGDQHLACVIRHGIEGFDDGPVQFSGPAGATLFQRWFEPAGPLPNARNGLPHTGDFADGFGNRFRLIAVANPKIAKKNFKAGALKGQNLGDEALKSEGYGLIRVRKSEQVFVLECWPKTEDPEAGGQQFVGWPVRIPFPSA